MALPTTEHHVSPPQQHPSPGVGTHGAQPPPPSGVGMMGAQPVAGPAEAAKPVLFADIDPVLLVRLYPGATDAADMRAQAMAAGVAAYEQGAELVASQQEPVVIEGAPPVPPPSPQHRAGPGPQREA